MVTSVKLVLELLVQMVLCDHDLNIDAKQKLEMSTAGSEICALTQKTTGRSEGWKPVIYILVVDDSKLIRNFEFRLHIDVV